MRRARRRLTYGNVVATLALFLALSGGAVWAANKITSKQIGKGAVKNKNLAKNAVKAKNLAKGSVTSAKLGKNAVNNAAIADGVVNFAKLAAGTNVIASSTAGPLPANQKSSTTVSFNPPLTVTPAPGQPLTVNIEARGTLSQPGEEGCSVIILPTVNGNPMVIGEVLSLQSPDNPPEAFFPNGIPVASISFPVGLAQPGVAQSIGATVVGDEDCTAGSRVDQIAVVVTQEK
jgi:predicted permease